MVRALDTLVVHAPQETALFAAVKALQAMKATITEVNKSNMEVRAMLGRSWYACGEEIQISIIPLAENLTSVKVISKARSPFQVVDAGKNAANIEEFESKLQNELGKHEPGA